MEQALAEPLRVREDTEDDLATTDSEARLNSWYVDTVICDVRDDLMEKYGISSQIASNMINSGGLSIY